MGKRFTDPNKWDDPWFTELNDQMKLLWLYLCDKCDNAGVWVVNPKLAEFQLGFRIDWQLAINVFEGRVEILPGGRKWHLTKFVSFQQPGGLSDKKNAHRQILRLLSIHGLSENVPKFIPSGNDPDAFPIAPCLVKSSLPSEVFTSSGSPEGDAAVTFAEAPLDLPERLRETYAEIYRANGAEIASKALSAARRIFHGPTAKQLLETWKAAHAAGKISAPADEWPDFREKIKRERAKEKSGGAGDAITDDRLSAYSAIPVIDATEEPRERY